MFGLRRWSMLNEVEARRLADEWWATQEERLRWLRVQLPHAGSSKSQGDLLRPAWSWYLQYRDTEVVDFDPTTLVWLGPTDAGRMLHASTAALLGADAVAHLVEAVVRETTTARRVVVTSTKVNDDEGTVRSPGLVVGRRTQPIWYIKEIQRCLQAPDGPQGGAGHQADYLVGRVEVAQRFATLR